MNGVFRICLVSYTIAVTRLPHIIIYYFIKKVLVLGIEIFYKVFGKTAMDIVENEIKYIFPNRTGILIIILYFIRSHFDIISHKIICTLHRVRKLPTNIETIVKTLNYCYKTFVFQQNDIFIFTFSYILYT